MISSKSLRLQAVIEKMNHLERFLSLILIHHIDYFQFSILLSNKMLMLFVTLTMFIANIPLGDGQFEDIFCLRLQETSTRRLQDIFVRTNLFTWVTTLQKTYSKRLDQDIYIRLSHTSLRRLDNFFKTSCQNIFKTYYYYFYYYC